MKHCQKITLLLLSPFVVTVHILTLGTLVWCGEPSELVRLRRGVQKTSVVSFTRLMLELKGERPLSVEPVPPDKLVISFRELRSKIEPQVLISDPASTVTAIKILDAANGSQVLVQFRNPDSIVSHSFLPPEKPSPGAYRLMVDILPPAKGKARENGSKESKTTISAPEKAPGMETSANKPQPGEASGKNPKPGLNAREKPGDTASIKSPPGSPDPAPARYREIPETSLSEPLKEANRLLTKGDHEQAAEVFRHLIKDPKLSREESAIAIHGLADATYYMHEQELEFAAKELVTQYLNAIKADPSLVQAGWAYYRLGLIYEASGSREKAVKAFEKLLQDYPGHPAAQLCWLALGVSYHKAGSHPQAVNALRAALELPLGQPDRARAYWLLGIASFGMGEYADAAQAFEQCLNEDPDFHLSQPLLLKYLGEAYFFQKEYDKGRDLLLRYLNLQPDAANRALILAKIAETFSSQEEPEYAGKLFDHIQNTYPDSDGDIITQIRRAELLKSKGKLSPESDLSLFRELAQKPLSPQLTKLIHLKLASREHEYGNFDESLSIIDYNLQEEVPGASNRDFQALRPKVLADWLQSAHQNRDHGTVITLFEKNQHAFTGNSTVDIHHMIADSYVGVGQYQKAIALYDQLLAKKGATAAGELLLKMAEAAYFARDLEGAEKYCSQIQGPDLELKRKLLLAQIAFVQQRYDAVVESLSRLSDTDIPASGRPNLHRIYGESLAQIGECDKASPWLQRTAEQMEKTDTHSDELVHCYLVQASCLSKTGRPDKAIAMLEEASSIAGTENLRDQLHYDISKRYLELGQTEKAIRKLTKLMSSNQSFWQTAAKQQLDYIQMERK